METEIKLAVPGAAEGCKLLREAGFAVHVERIFERNLVLDDDVQTLRNSERLLRVREAGRKVTCTFKGPSKPGPHKQREEREFEASDFEAALQLFAGLGYAERFRYEKFRTEFVEQGRRAGAGVATLDETPIGCFLELEGDAAWIDQMAAKLGFTNADYITESYGKLYFDWCATRGIKPTNFVFHESSSNQKR